MNTGRTAYRLPPRRNASTPHVNPGHPSAHASHPLPDRDMPYFSTLSPFAGIHPMTATAPSINRAHIAVDTPMVNRVPVTAEQHTTFPRNGFVVIRGLVPPDDIAALRQHTDDLMQGRLPEQRGTHMAE